jgi:lysozyme family protein
MTDAFPRCLSVTLGEEGGFTNNPADPGGATNLGVTKRVWEAWVGHGVSVNDMRALTVADVTPLYRAQFWQACACDRLPPAMALCVFDWAVNGGPSRAARDLQQVVGAVADGHIGDGTLKALQQAATKRGLGPLIQQYLALRRAYYHSRPTFATFGKGWLARVDVIEGAALRMM